MTFRKSNGLLYSCSIGKIALYNTPALRVDALMAGVERRGPPQSGSSSVQLKAQTDKSGLVQAKLAIRRNSHCFLLKGLDFFQERGRRHSPYSTPSSQSVDVVTLNRGIQNVVEVGHVAGVSSGASSTSELNMLVQACYRSAPSSPTTKTTLGRG